MLHLSYRTVILIGMTALVFGSFLMSRVSVNSTVAGVMVNMALVGIGMGLSLVPYMIAIQSSVAHNVLGTATATLQFSRVIGGAVGVSVMGVILSMKVAANLIAAGAGKGDVSLQNLIQTLHTGSPAMDMTLRGALTGAVESVFVSAFIAAVAGFFVSILTPCKHLERSSGGHAASSPPSGEKK